MLSVVVSDLKKGAIMGKIFDALEKKSKEKKLGFSIAKKSDIKNVVSSIRSNRKEKYPSRTVIAESPGKKVVMFNHSNKSFLASRIDEKLVTYHKPQSVESDIFKMLRTNILFPMTGKPPKIILVCSALPGDGKSFVSSNLAVSIASGIEENVLLIDCDIRKPSIHKVFGLDRSVGLSDYLKGEKDFSKLMLKTCLKKLHIVPGGLPPNNPTELLSSKKMKELLVDIKKRYDDRYIIIDSPPPAMAPETHVIEKYVDGVILVVKSGKTPRKAVLEVIAQFEKEKIIGIVLNHAEQKVKKYYGHTKSYYEE